MGTDIHAFIETDVSGEFASASSIQSLTQGAYVLERDSRVFDALAGAHEHQLSPEDRDASHDPLIRPRGMPDPHSLCVSREFFYLVDDPTSNFEPPNKWFWPPHRCIDILEAAEWSVYPECVKATITQWFNGEKTWSAISPPGLIYPTWMTPSEFDESLLHHGLQLSTLAVSYRILRNALELAESEYGVGCVRLVLWFDH